MNTLQSEISNQGARILIVSDDLNNIKVIRKNLFARGYDVELALDNTEAIEMAENNEFALLIIILDFENPQIDSFDLCQQLSNRCRSPIIALSSEETETYKIKAFDYGIDDYMVMPFNLDEFLARVRSTIKRWARYKSSAAFNEKYIVINDLYINIESRNVTVRGKKVRLTPTEYEILLYMAKNKGKVISHKEMLKAIWGDAYGSEREYLRVYISQLRKKIEKDITHSEYIFTEPGIGYRFGNE